MHFIYILQLQPQYRIASNWTDETRATVGQHWNYLVDLHSKGIVKVVGRTDYDIDHTHNRGYCIFEAESVEKANEIMVNDPCVIKGVMTAELHPLKLFMLDKQLLKS